MRWGEMIQAAAITFSCTVVGIGLIRVGKHAYDALIRMERGQERLR